MLFEVCSADIRIFLQWIRYSMASPGVAAQPRLAERLMCGRPSAATILYGKDFGGDFGTGNPPRGTATKT